MNRTLSRLPSEPWYWAIFIKPRGGYLFLYPGSISRMFFFTCYRPKRHRALRLTRPSGPPPCTGVYDSSAEVPLWGKGRRELSAVATTARMVSRENANWVAAWLPLPKHLGRIACCEKPLCKTCDGRRGSASRPPHRCHRLHPTCNVTAMRLAIANDREITC